MKFGLVTAGERKNPFLLTMISPSDISPAPVASHATGAVWLDFIDQRIPDPPIVSEEVSLGGRLATGMMDMLGSP